MPSSPRWAAHRAIHFWANSVSMSSRGMKSEGFEPDHIWTADERQHFVAGLTYFRDALRKQSPEELPVTPADALLVWLRVSDHIAGDGGRAVALEDADPLVALLDVKAALVWLRVYSFEQLWSFSAAELTKSVAAVWPDIKLFAADKPISVSTETEEQKAEDAWSLAKLPGRLKYTRYSPVIR